MVNRRKRSNFAADLHTLTNQEPKFTQIKNEEHKSVLMKARYLILLLVALCGLTAKAQEAVEALGVRVQCSFGKELITASVPVDNFMKVAELGEVTRINVATPMRLSTAAARKDSHTLDALTHSTAT